MSLDRNRPALSNKTTGSIRKTSRGSSHLHPLRNHSVNDEIFTDSIMSDGSKIPTPSPTKPELASPAIHPRRTIGNTKTLRDAWDATASKERPLSRPNDLATVRHIKSHPTAARRSSPAADLPQIKTRKNTPSPAGRGYGRGLASPESTMSSPPKGLTEAYQRIADEEDLAGLEGPLSDEEEVENDRLQYEADKARMERIKKSDSQLSLRRQRRESPHLNGNGLHLSQDNKENVLRDDTELSKASDLSFINQLTDQDLAAKLTPHALDKARDKARLQRTIQKDSPITFGRGISGLKGQSADSVLLHDRPDDQNFTGSSNGSGGSGRSDRLDMSMNVPRSWGTKGKVGKDWLNRIHRNDRAVASETSLVDWTAAAADIPLPPNGDLPSSHTGSSRDTTPVSLNHKSSLDKLRQWELNDFTGTSLQASNSPPVRPRNTTLDQIRDLEIESLERRAVTTNRLDELRKRESSEKMRKSSITPPVIEAPKFEEPKSTKSVKFEDHGEAIPNTPIVVFRQGSNGGPIPPPDSSITTTAQPQEDGDSLEDLKRLSRAISESPRAIPSEEVSIALNDFLWKKGIDGNTELPRAGDDLSHATPLPSRLSALDLATKTPVVTGAWTDTIMPDTVGTIKQAANGKYLKTPHVLGGWVDTPLPASKKDQKPHELPEDLVKGIGKPKEEQRKEDAVILRSSQKKSSAGPLSALAGLLSKVRDKKTTEHGDNQDTSATDEKVEDLGDLTIESLEDLLTLDNADMTTLIRMSAELDARRALSKQMSDPDALPEEMLLNRLSGKLERLQNNIHSTRRGISRLEKNVSHEDGPLIPHDGTMNDYLSPCAACGSIGGVQSPNTTTISLTLPFQLPTYLQLFHFGGNTQTSPRSVFRNIPRPTVLGWVLLTFWTYYYLENLLCIQYCHPMYAEYYEWPEEPEPRYGIVIPTLLWRNSGMRFLFRLFFGDNQANGLRGVARIGWMLCVACVRLFGRLFGLWDGFVSEGTGSTTAMDGASPSNTGIPGLEDPGSMAYDEYL